MGATGSLVVQVAQVVTGALASTSAATSLCPTLAPSLGVVAVVVQAAGAPCSARKSLAVVAVVAAPRVLVVLVAPLADRPRPRLRVLASKEALAEEVTVVLPVSLAVLVQKATTVQQAVPVALLVLRW